jgi:copper chaperone NosL
MPPFLFGESDGQQLYRQFRIQGVFMRRRTFLIFSTVAILLSILSMTAFADSDIDQHRDCKHCGMDRKVFGYSRMLVEYKDGKNAGTCSLNCVVAELNSNKSGEVISIKVADFNTKQLIDAEKAVWVIGGSKRGVMTMRAKWAFAAKDAARLFIDEYGGTIASWSEALAAAKEDN